MRNTQEKTTWYTRMPVPLVSSNDWQIFIQIMMRIKSGLTKENWKAFLQRKLLTGVNGKEKLFQAVSPTGRTSQDEWKSIKSAIRVM